MGEMMDDMGEMMGGMGAMMLLFLLLLVLVIAAGVYIALRASGKKQAEGGDSARELLDRRLAAGEIDSEEYYEREAVLRGGEARPGKRRAG